MAGALIFMSKIDYDQPMNLLLALSVSLFLLILSVLGFGVVISQSLGFQNYIMNVLMILNYWKKTGFYKDPKKPFFLKRSYRYFYEITIWFFMAFSLFFAYQFLSQNLDPTGLLYKVLISIPFRAFLIILLMAAPFLIEMVLYRRRWKKYSMKRLLLIKALRNGIGLYQPDWDKQFEEKDSNLWKKIKKVYPDEFKSLEKIF